MPASVTTTGRSGAAPSASLAFRQHCKARTACASLRAWAAGTLPHVPVQKVRTEPSGDVTFQEREEEEDCGWKGLGRKELEGKELYSGRKGMYVRITTPFERLQEKAASDRTAEPVQPKYNTAW